MQLKQWAKIQYRDSECFPAVRQNLDDWFLTFVRNRYQTESYRRPMRDHELGQKGHREDIDNVIVYLWNWTTKKTWTELNMNLILNEVSNSTRKRTTDNAIIENVA